MRPTIKELNLINKYTRKKMSESEVETFRMMLCDNKVDEDFERITLSSLNKMAEMWLGKSGYINIDDGYCGRIYDTWVEIDNHKYVDQYENYARLYAKFYLIKNKVPQKFLLKLKTEGSQVSVGCSFQRRSCSICGMPYDEANRCHHKQGEKYLGIDAEEYTCYHLLCDPVDVYEWSIDWSEPEEATGSMSENITCYHPSESGDFVIDVSKFDINAWDGRLAIKIKYHDPELQKLEKIEAGDWIDLRAAEDVELKAGDYRLLSLGVSMKLPDGYEAHVVPRSSTFKTWGILQSNSMGVIDNSYSGTNDIWQFPAYATRDTVIHKNDRICQFRIVPILPAMKFQEVDTLDDADRGGFGSTGIQ